MADLADPADHGPKSMDRIKRQLSASGRFLLQGPLLKRSETLRKWNQRWFTLDPTTGRMEYRIQRNDISPKGFIKLDAGSSILLSPLNLLGSVKYDGCGIYIQNSMKTEYFLCAETPGVARAWVSTLQATQLVLRAHKEAVNSLGGNAPSTLGTVSTVVAAANATAKEAAKEISAALQPSTIKPKPSEGTDGILDNLSIMKETLRVKDEELHQMAKDMRAKDATIKDLAERLSETAEAAEAAASAAHIMDKERKIVRNEIAKLRIDVDEKLQSSSLQLKSMEAKLLAAERERDEAIREAQLWRAELAKAKECAVVRDAALIRATALAELNRKAGSGRDVEVAAVSEEAKMSTKSGVANDQNNSDSVGEAPVPTEDEELQKAVIHNSRNEEAVLSPLLEKGSQQQMHDSEFVQNMAPKEPQCIGTDSISVPESLIEGIIIKDVIAPNEP